MIRILLADDHYLTLLGTKSYLEHLGYHIVETCTNGISAFNLIQLHKPDIAILDIEMPGMNGLEIMIKLREEGLDTKIIFITMHKEFSIYNKAKMYNLGGYLLKDKAPTELDDCILAVLKNEVYISKYIESELILDSSDSSGDLALLTPIELKIVDLISKQLTTKKIGELLFVSEKTIEKHRTNIIEKLNLPKEKNILLKWAMHQQISTNKKL